MGTAESYTVDSVARGAHYQLYSLTLDMTFHGHVNRNLFYLHPGPARAFVKATSHFFLARGDVFSESGGDMGDRFV